MGILIMFPSNVKKSLVKSFAITCSNEDFRNWLTNLGDSLLQIAEGMKKVMQFNEVENRGVLRNSLESAIGRGVIVGTLSSIR